MKKILILFFMLVGVIIYAERFNYSDEVRDAIVKNDIMKMEEIFENQNRINYFIEPSEKVRFFRTALEKNRTEIVKLFIEDGLEINYFEEEYYPVLKTPLYYACQNNNEELIQFFLNLGAVPLYDELPDEDLPQTLILYSIIEKNNKFLKLCIENGFDPSSMNYLSVDLLKEALEANNLEAFEIFISMNVKIDKINLLNDFKTTLAIAVSKYGENSEYVKILKSKGAYSIDYRYSRPYKGYCNTKNLRIRSEANTNSNIIGLLQENDEVQMLGVSPLAYNIDDMEYPWVYIKKGELIGWVFGGYLEKEQIDNKGIFH